MLFFFIIGRGVRLGVSRGNAAAASSGTYRRLPEDDNENVGHLGTSSSNKQPINGISHENRAESARG